MATSMSFRYEAWTEYGLGVAVLLLRYYARWKAVRFKGWEGDDYAALVALVFWTLAVCSLDVIVQHGTNLGITDDIGRTLSSEQIASREYGSKWILAGRNIHVTLVWLLKACMLCFYNRIVRGLPQQVYVKCIGVACVIAYAGAVSGIWAKCSPVQKHWQVVPYPGDSCTHANLYYLVLVVLNVTTDIAIVSIPLSWLSMLKITFWRRVAIGALLCSGLFIMGAALVRSVLTLLNIESINTTCMWSIREPFVAIIVVNAGAIKPLFSKSRWISSRKRNSPSPPSHTKWPSPISSPQASPHDKSANAMDLECGDYSSERTVHSSEHSWWLKKETSANSMLG